ncbi:MAG: hypothetical protein KBT46_01250 [Ruminococcus sp.]|nr:hypothetical protein [Candidatus Copronaster equi]
MKSQMREVKHLSGDYLEIDVFPVRSVFKNRKAKFRPSRECQIALNRRNSARRLTWLIQENFGTKDFLCELSYPSDFPYDRAVSGKEFNLFISSLRREAKKQNIEVKYIHNTEIGEKNKRPHHHFIVNGELGANFIKNQWNKRFTKNPKINYIHMKNLKFTKTGLAGAAFYFCKDPILAHHSYCCSKNLKHPEAKKRDGRISGKVLKELRNDIYNAELFEQLYPGYAFVDADPRMNLYEIDPGGECSKIDFPYINIRMYRKNSKYILRNEDIA